MNLNVMSATILHKVRVWFRGDREGGAIPFVNTLGDIGQAKRVPASTGSANVQISATARAVSIYARGGVIRYEVGTTNAVAANNATSHYLSAGERAEFMVADPCWIAAIRAADAGADGVLEITEIL